MGTTAIKRRYRDNRLPEYQIYTDAFDRALQNSKVFNTDQFVNIHSIIWDETGVRAEIQILEKATIPALKEKLQACVANFESYCTQRENAGYERPTVWPPHLLKDRCQIEALLDVSLRELEFLKSKLDELFIKPVVKKAADQLLAYGPVGNGRLRDGILAEIDGQECQMIDGVLIIVSEGSPYKGLRVRDYRAHIVQPFCEARNRRLRELNEKRKMEIDGQGFAKTALLLGPRKIDKSSLPPWPEGIRNYLLPQQEEPTKKEGNDQ